MNTMHVLEKSKIERIEFRLIFALCYSLLLFLVIANRMLPKRIQPISTVDRSKNVFGETKEITGSVIPFIYM